VRLLQTGGYKLLPRDVGPHTHHAGLSGNRLYLSLSDSYFSLDIQDLIDRGWRRSGQYCYKPTMARTCCPLYTIKCDAVKFKPTKSQKKVIKKFINYIVNGKRPGTGMSDTLVEEGDGDQQEVVGDRVEEVKGMKVEKELGLKNLDGLGRLDKVDKEVTEKPVIEEKLDRNNENYKSDISEGDKITVANSKHLPFKVVAPPKGMDPNKPMQSKAKLARREKWEKKVKDGKVESSTKEQYEKTVEELLDLTKFSSPSHTFTKRLVKADENDADFKSSFTASLQVYQKYQMAVHGDAKDKCTDKQFRRFLCSSPLQAGGGLGSFHLQYLIDEIIVAVGVIDILPHCVSSGEQSALV